MLQASMSLGSTALLALGLGLLDESVAPTKSPACIGVVIGSSLMGFQAGLMISKYAIHVSVVSNLAGDIAWMCKLIEPTNFFILMKFYFFKAIGLCLIVVSVIIALFPSRLITSRSASLIRNSLIYRNNRYGVYYDLFCQKKKKNVFVIF